MPLEQMLALAMIIIGVIMLLAEAATPGNFLVVPATVLLILGFVGFVAPGLLFSWFSPILAVIIIIPTTLLTIKFYQRMAPPAPPETVVASSIIGRVGVVTVDLAPNSLKGKVRIEHDDYSATAATCIPKGAKIRVVSSEGVHVNVEEVSTEGVPQGSAAECK